MNDPAPATSSPDQDDSARPGPDPAGPRVSTSEMKDLSRLRRSVSDRHVAGVAGGVARHFDVDPVIVRVAFVVAAFFGGAGLLLYFSAWLFVPEEGSDDRPLGLDERSRSAALIGVAVLALLAAVGDWAGAFWFPWPVALLALGVVWLLHRNQPSQVQAGAPVGSFQATGTLPAAPVPPMAPIDYTRMPPRNPRKRGPVLFWFTLALIALAEGALLVGDLAGVDVMASAYPALALAITAAMLVLGAFWGRAGGLILVALLAAGGTWAVAAAEGWQSQDLRYAPTQTSQIRDTYELNSGELVLDLSRLQDADSLDGQEIRIDGGVGRIEVIVPSDVDAQVATDVGVGSATLFGTDSGGLGMTRERTHTGDDGVTDVHIDIDMGVGEVVVRHQGGTR